MTFKAYQERLNYLLDLVEKGECPFSKTNGQTIFLQRKNG